MISKDHGFREFHELATHALCFENKIRLIREITASSRGSYDKSRG